MEKKGSVERKEVVTARKTKSASEVSATVENEDVRTVVVTDGEGDVPVGIVELESEMSEQEGSVAEADAGTETASDGAVEADGQ
jgi:CBS domain-containing protein